MHTKKRHQNMLQDLNRKLHYAEKDRESPASDSKVKTNDNWGGCRGRGEKKREKKTETKTEAMKGWNIFDLYIKKIPNNTTNHLYIELQIALPSGHLNKDVFSSFLQSVRWSVSSGGSDKTNHSVSVYIQPHILEIYCIDETHHHIRFHLPRGVAMSQQRH